MVKLTVKDLKEKIKDLDDDLDVVLAFYLKDQANHCVYLADVLNVKFDGVAKERLYNSSVVELCGFDDDYATYVEKEND